MEIRQELPDVADLKLDIMVGTVKYENNDVGDNFLMHIRQMGKKLF